MRGIYFEIDTYFFCKSLIPFILQLLLYKIFLKCVLHNRKEIFSEMYIFSRLTE